MRTNFKDNDNNTHVTANHILEFIIFIHVTVVL